MLLVRAPQPHVGFNGRVHGEVDIEGESRACVSPRVLVASGISGIDCGGRITSVGFMLRVCDAEGDPPGALLTGRRLCESLSWCSLDITSRELSAC